ncbi:MAG: hypothetical protein PHT84_05530, partial [Candidatus Pacebacteria bacterium]|nr:hypothetical protein [Candidatus Paceibacterota bacterium]
VFAFLSIIFVAVRFVFGRKKMMAQDEQGLDEHEPDQVYRDMEQYNQLLGFTRESETERRALEIEVDRLKEEEEKNSIEIDAFFLAYDLKDSENAAFLDYLEDALIQMEQLKAEYESLSHAEMVLIQNEEIESLQKMASSRNIDEGFYKNPELIQKELDAIRDRRMVESQKLTKAESLLAGLFENIRTPDRIEEEIESLEEKKKKLLISKTALDVALEVLQSAHKKIENMFAPELSTDIAEIFSYVTDEERTLFLEMKLGDSISLRKEGGNTHKLEEYSLGTKDLVYLILRMIISRKIYGEFSPVFILDDTFARIDMDRLERLAKVMGEKIQDVQMILMTCRAEESAVFEKIGNVIQI